MQQYAKKSSILSLIFTLVLLLGSILVNNKLDSVPDVKNKNLDECNKVTNSKVIFKIDPTVNSSDLFMNGPSVIKVPTWIKNPLGQYYMYFADHNGSYIRMGFADRLSGPWEILEGGVLSLEQVPLLDDHIASPDIYIDDNLKKIYLTVHGVDKESSKNKQIQKTIIAESNNGTIFTQNESSKYKYFFDKPYIRIIEINDFIYIFALENKGGIKNFNIFRSQNIMGKFELVTTLKTSENIRHFSLAKFDNYLEIYYSRIGDAPERILKKV